MFYGTATINESNNLEIGGCDTVKLAKEFSTLYMLWMKPISVKIVVLTEKV